MVDGSVPAMLQPWLVWRVARPVVALLMFSIMSTSPCDGHDGPTIQKAGHVPQPTGMCVN